MGLQILDQILELNGELGMKWTNVHFSNLNDQLFNLKITNLLQVGN